MDHEWLTPDEFAAANRMSGQAVRRLIRQRRIPARYLANLGPSLQRPRWRVRADAMDAFKVE